MWKSPYIKLLELSKVTKQSLRFILHFVDGIKIS